MSYATCHTSGCGNEGVTIDEGDLTFIDDLTGEPVLDEDGNEQQMPVTCGPCGVIITDVTDSPPGGSDK